MFCTKCGQSLAEEAKFCPSCGGKILGEKVVSLLGAELEVNGNIEWNRESSKKYTHRRWLWIAVGLISVIFCVIAAMSDSSIEIIKKGTLNAYPNVTIEEAFNNFFGDNDWKVIDDMGENKIIQFSGKCTYSNVEVLAKMEFVLFKDRSFKISSLSFNDVPQEEYMREAVIEKVYEKYNK